MRRGVKGQTNGACTVIIDFQILPVYNKMGRKKNQQKNPQLKGNDWVYLFIKIVVD